MEQDSEQPSVAEKRAFAVARLKRAASLPRMKDGRRPRMHLEGVSDGERSQNEDKKDDDISFVSEAKTEVTLDKSDPPDSDATTETTTLEPASARKRRVRSRSRSRSRSSRDFKLKLKGTQSPTPKSGQSPAPSPLFRGGECSADESTAPPTIITPSAAPVISPIPSHFTGLQAPSILLTTTTPIIPESPLFYPGTSPPTPMLPSLEALQRGLFRSNSASARLVALQKLTNGADSFDVSFPSPSTPPPSSLARNNTVSGGEERSLARRVMLERLAGRKKEGDGGSNDDVVQHTPVPSPSSVPTTVTPEVPRSPLLHSPGIPESSASSSPPIISPRRTPERLNYSPAITPPVGINAIPRRRRSVVIEPEDPPSLPSPMSTPVSRLAAPDAQAAYLSDEPSEKSGSERDSGVGVPVYISTSQRTPSRQDRFPITPVPTPLKDKPFRREEPEEEILFAGESRNQMRDVYGREISWVADPVPESRIPILEDGDRSPSPRSPRAFTPQLASPPSSSSKDLVIESETSPAVTLSNVPPSPSSVTALSNTPCVARTSDDSGSSPQTFPTRLSVASRIQSDRSPLSTDFGDTEESRPVVIDSTVKRPSDNASTSAWEKVKNTFTGGRRSRTNSIITRDRRDNTDSCVSRESGASLTGPRLEKDASVAQQQTQTPVMQTPSASASISSLSPLTVSRGGASPVPPPSSADLSKYQDSKLFPFPGMKLPEEQRHLVKVMPSVLSPDASMSSNGDLMEHIAGQSGPGDTPSMVITSEQSRDRKLSHQTSETRLLTKYSTPNSPALSAAPSSSSHMEYTNILPSLTPPSNSSSLKLPMNREGVKVWLKAKFSSQSSSNTTNSASPNAAENKGHKTDKKPSLSDLLKRKETELITDWEEVQSDKSRTSTTATINTPRAKQVSVTDSSQYDVQETPRPVNDDRERLMKALEINVPSRGSYSDTEGFISRRAPSEHLSSATPDPLSSIDDYAPRSTSESSSATSSQDSRFPSRSSPSQGTIVLGRLDEMLGRGSRSPMWASAIEEPPRKLLLSSPVLQVANSNTVKDRFLFLFSDILVIAKPIVQDHNQLLQASKPSPLDRKFIVKSVVLLRHLRFCADREEPRSRMSNFVTSPRHPLLRTFVYQFAKDPDHAITILFEKSKSRDDPVVLGQLLFRTLDIDRVRLGDYLSRRTSKLVLKAFIDAFGFTGLRVDRALRAFLLSLHVPGRTTHAHGPREYLLDAFATRWYEANADSVVFDKDLAIRLVRALVQLNDVLHGGIAHEPGSLSYPKRNISSKEFLEVFRRYDARSLVSDDLLDDLYNSIRQERLSHARNHLSNNNSPDINVTIKRALPPRLTYRVQSEPIVLRIPQPDAHLTINLYGQDLIFDPPSLNFARSSEASFRVTGTSFGLKSMIMCRSDANALKYGGLPLSCPILIERAFMRNTFQVAFMNQDGNKRRYMFSIDDPVIRHQWTVSLKQQIESSKNPTTAPSTTRTPTFYRAAESISFKVLQEVLLGAEKHQARSSLRSPSGGGGGCSKRPLSPYSNGRTDELRPPAVTHGRSHSRSQVYHRHGPGKLELELNLSDDEGDARDLDVDDQSMQGQDVFYQGGVRLWSGRDLEMQCLRNSSIALVLSYLQVGSPDHDSMFS